MTIQAAQDILLGNKRRPGMLGTTALGGGYGYGGGGGGGGFQEAAFQRPQGGGGAPPPMPQQTDGGNPFDTSSGGGGGGGTGGINGPGFQDSSGLAGSGKVPPGYEPIPDYPNYFFNPLTKDIGVISGSGVDQYGESSVSGFKWRSLSKQEQKDFIRSASAAGADVTGGAGGDSGGGGSATAAGNLSLSQDKFAYQQQQDALAREQDAAKAQALAAQNAATQKYNNRGQDEQVIQNAMAGRENVASALSRLADLRHQEQADPFKGADYMKMLGDLPQGTGNPLQSLISSGKTIAPNYGTYDEVAGILRQLLDQYNKVPDYGNAQHARDVLEDPATHDAATRFLSQPDEALQRYFGGHASGGMQMLREPTLLVGAHTGKILGTAAENGNEGVRQTGDGFQFYPQPGVSRRIDPQRESALLATAAGHAGGGGSMLDPSIGDAYRLMGLPLPSDRRTPQQVPDGGYPDPIDRPQRPTGKEPYVPFPGLLPPPPQFGHAPPVMNPPPVPVGPVAPPRQPLPPYVGRGGPVSMPRPSPGDGSMSDAYRLMGLPMPHAAGSWAKVGSQLGRTANANPVHSQAQDWMSAYAAYHPEDTSYRTVYGQTYHQNQPHPDEMTPSGGAMPGETLGAFNARMDQMAAQEERDAHGGTMAGSLARYWSDLMHGPRDSGRLYFTMQGSHGPIQASMTRGQTATGPGGTIRYEDLPGATPTVPKAPFWNGQGQMPQIPQGAGAPGGTWGSSALQQTAGGGGGGGAGDGSQQQTAPPPDSASMAKALGKSLRAYTFTPPEVLAYLDRGQAPPPGTVGPDDGGFMKNLPPFMKKMLQDVIKSFGVYPSEGDYTQARQQFHLPGLSLNVSR